MAFPANSGYTNLPNGNFSPTIFSQKALKTFRKVSVIEDITNNDYYGEIANYGDSVKIIKEPTVVINDYKRGKAVAPQSLTDDSLTLVVDQAREFSFAIDDIEQAHSHVNFESLSSDKAAYELKNSFDAHCLNFVATSAATTNYIGSTKVGDVETVAAVKVATGTTPSATAFTPLGLLNRLKRRMDLLNIPQEGRYVVADPFFWEQLGDEDSKLMSAFITGDSKSPLFNGRVTSQQLRGFDLYESNNLPLVGAGPDATSGTATNYGTIIAGHRSAVATVNQIAKTEKFRSPTYFADVVRGLHLFGRGVIRPEALFVVRYTVK